MGVGDFDAYILHGVYKLRKGLLRFATTYIIDNQ